MVTARATCVTAAVAVFVLSDCKVATMLTLPSLGIGVGAVYRPVESIVPHPVPEQLHITAVEVVPVTVAVNCCVSPPFSEAIGGEIVTLIGGGGGVLEPDPPQPIINIARRTVNSSTNNMRVFITASFRVVAHDIPC
jgi:hypothetical protein